MERSRMDRGRLISLIAGLALIAAALPGVSAAQDQPAVNIVEPSPTDALGWGFDPVNLSVAAGQTVTWTNTGAQQHTVTADDMSLDSGLIDPDNAFSFEFDTPGIYAYHCTPHPWMKATITVSG